MLMMQKDLSNYSIDSAKKALFYHLSREFVAQKHDFMINFLEKLKIEWFYEIDSTNTYLFQSKEYQALSCKQDDPQIALCSAWSQTAGQGTHQRSWLNQPYQGLLFSLAFNLPKLKYGLSLMMGYAVTQALNQAFLCIEPTFFVKWPNDIYFQGKKLGGILMQSRHHANGIYIVLGMGLNLTPFESEEDREETEESKEGKEDNLKLKYANLSHLLRNKDSDFYFELFAKILTHIWRYLLIFQTNGLNVNINEIRQVLYKSEGLEFTYHHQKIKALKYQLLNEGFLQILTDKGEVLILK